MGHDQAKIGNVSAQKREISEVIAEIEALPDDWHDVGSVTPSVLRAIARHASLLGKITHSVETGCGKTTLLFSHLSENHLVFAIDDGLSVTKARTSPILNPTSVTFVEGLTQVTLPRYEFGSSVQLALIDGPHGYPFPDLEYFYLFPLIAPGGLLLLDDIKIPTIRRMYEIIKADETLRLLEVVDDNLAVFERTDAPGCGLTSDSWWRQGYNRPYYEGLVSPPPKHENRGARPGVRKIYRGLSHKLPPSIKSLVPRALRNRMWRALDQ